jgi:hypothetical protein
VKLPVKLMEMIAFPDVNVTPLIVPSESVDGVVPRILVVVSHASQE